MITGASRGLGREIALTLAKSGYNVAINYLASENDAKKAAYEIGDNAFLVKADVGDAKQVEEMADAVYRKWGRVDVLINNAGITKDSLMIKLKEAEWDEILRVNLKGCFNTIRAFSRVMIKTGRRSDSPRRGRAYREYLFIFRSQRQRGASSLQCLKGSSAWPNIYCGKGTCRV